MIIRNFRSFDSDVIHRTSLELLTPDGVLENCFGGASFADDCASLMSSILGQSSCESKPGFMGATIKAFARGVFEELILRTG